MNNSKNYSVKKPVATSPKQNKEQTIKSSISKDKPGQSSKDLET